jgi:hypothetical protein
LKLHLKHLHVDVDAVHQRPGDALLGARHHG